MKFFEPHPQPLVCINFLPFSLALKIKARKAHTNPGVQMCFGNVRANQECFRFDCRERYRVILKSLKSVFKHFRVAPIWFGFQFLVRTVLVGKGFSVFQYSSSRNMPFLFLGS